MQYTKRFRSHGIDEKDFKILKRIFKSPKGSTEISDEVSMPRPTVLFRLNKMSDRGLIIKSGSRPYIKWSPSKVCFNIIENDGNPITESKTKGIVNIENRLKRLLEEACNKRVFYLKNVSYIRNADKKFSKDYKNSADYLILKGNVLQEGITSISGSVYYRKMDPERRPLNIKKMVSWIVVDDEYIDDEDSFLILEDTVLIINLEKEYLKEVRSSTLAKMIISQIRNLSRMGKKINLSRFIKEECQ